MATAYAISKSDGVGVKSKKEIIFFRKIVDDADDSDEVFEDNKKCENNNHVVYPYEPGRKLEDVFWTMWPPGLG